MKVSINTYDTDQLAQATIEELGDAVERCREAADRAFRRYMEGEVATQAAAARYAAQVENLEMWVRTHNDYDATKAQHASWAGAPDWEVQDG